MLGAHTHNTWEKPMQIVLYYAPVACSLVPYVTLTEAGASFEVRTINLRKQQQMSPEYLAINLKHKVPLLVVDGQTLSENVAIQQWVARQFPAAKLLPADPWQELQAISLMSWCASAIHPYLTRLNSPPKVCDVPGTEASVRRHAIEGLFDGLKIADDKLAGREHFFDHFTAADVHFYWCWHRAKLFQDVDLSGFRNCVAHHERLQRRASIAKVLAYEKSVMAEFAKAA